MSSRHSETPDNQPIPAGDGIGWVSGVSECWLDVGEGTLPSAVTQLFELWASFESR